MNASIDCFYSYSIDLVFIVACNVLYLNIVDVESLPGHLAVSKALAATFENADRLQATIVHFKVSNAGITLTDTKKKFVSSSSSQSIN